MTDKPILIYIGNTYLVGVHLPWEMIQLSQIESVDFSLALEISDPRDPPATKMANSMMLKLCLDPLVAIALLAAQ